MNQTLIELLARVAKRYETGITTKQSSIALEVFSDGRGELSHVVLGDDGGDTVTLLLTWENEDDLRNQIITTLFTSKGGVSV